MSQVRQRFQRVAGELFWIGVGQALSALGALVGVRLLTSFLDPGSYGELALGVTVGTFLHQTLTGPLSNAVIRFYSPAQEAHQGRTFLLSIVGLLKYFLGIVLIATLLMCLGLKVLGHTSWIALCLGSALFALISGYSSILDGMQNAARDRAIVAWHQAIGQWLRFTLAVLAVILLGRQSHIAMLGYILAGIIVIGSQIFFFQRRIVLTTDPQPASQSEQIKLWSQRLRDYAWPFAVWGVFTWAQLSSDRWALNTFGTTVDVGLYAVLYQLGYYPVSMLSGMMVQFVVPVVFNRAGDGTDPTRMMKVRQLNQRLILVTLGATLLGVLTAFVLHKDIFLFLAAPKYREVSSLLPWMVLSGGLFATGQMASLQPMVNVRAKSLLAPKITTAVLGVLLNYAGAYWFRLPGVVGAGVTFSAFYLIWVGYLNVSANKMPSQPISAIE